MYELIKEKRLRKNKEYQFVYRRGKSYVSRLVVLYVLRRSSKQPTRIGFVTGKKNRVCCRKKSLPPINERSISLTSV